MIEITHKIMKANSEMPPEPDHDWTHHDLCNAIKSTYSTLDVILPNAKASWMQLHKSILFLGCKLRLNRLS